MAWYGVNYVLGTGLHSYGFGGGGQFYVFGMIVLQFLYVAIAIAVSMARGPGTHSKTSAIPVGENAQPAPEAVGRPQRVAS